MSCTRKRRTRTALFEIGIRKIITTPTSCGMTTWRPTTAKGNKQVITINSGIRVCVSFARYLDWILVTLFLLGMILNLSRTGDRWRPSSFSRIVQRGRGSSIRVHVPWRIARSSSTLRVEMLHDHALSRASNNYHSGHHWKNHFRHGQWRRYRWKCGRIVNYLAERAIHRQPKLNLSHVHLVKIHLFSIFLSWFVFFRSGRAKTSEATNYVLGFSILYIPFPSSLFGDRIWACKEKRKIIQR